VVPSADVTCCGIKVGGNHHKPRKRLKLKRIIIPLPSYGFDPTEVAIPWKLIVEAGHLPVFATPHGETAEADSLMLTGDRLGILKPLLRARLDAVSAYAKLLEDPAFQSPIPYSAIQSSDYDGILLAGGHDKGVIEYLESAELQLIVSQFFFDQKPVGAICHGVVLAARSLNPDTGASVLRGYKTTALLKQQELLAYGLTRLWLKDYYLTYPGLAVQDEVSAVLACKEDFIEGPAPLLRDDMAHLQRGYALRDRHYVSARWPGDAYSFSLAFMKVLAEPAK